MPKSKPPGRGKAPRALNALAKKSRSPQARWAVDYDYVHKLSPKDQKWLDQFTDEYYFSKSKPKLHTQEQLKDRWRAYKQNARDVTSRQTEDSPEVPRTVSDERLNNTENDIIEKVDAEKERKRIVDDAINPKIPIGSDWLC